MSCVGFEKVFRLIKVEIADCSIGVVLGRLTIHLKGANLCVIVCGIDTIVDHRKLGIIFIILKHKP